MISFIWISLLLSTVLDESKVSAKSSVCNNLSDLDCFLLTSFQTEIQKSEHSQFNGARNEIVEMSDLKRHLLRNENIKRNLEDLEGSETTFPEHISNTDESNALIPVRKTKSVFPILSQFTTKRKLAEKTEKDEILDPKRNGNRNFQTQGWK